MVRSRKVMRQKIRANREKFIKRARTLKRYGQQESKYFWKDERRFFNYGFAFESRFADFFGINVHNRTRPQVVSNSEFLWQRQLESQWVDVAKIIPRKGNRPLAIVEDGAGQGYFLATLKELLAINGIPCKTTALAVKENESLKELRTVGKIDRIVTGPAELYFPKSPVDWIVSYNGSITYSMNSIQKAHLLKFASALNRGGIMAIIFDAGVKKNLHGLKQAATLLETPKRGKRISLRQEMDGIERAFEKRGFRAKFYYKAPYERNEYALHAGCLLVQRVK